MGWGRVSAVRQGEVTWPHFLLRQHMPARGEPEYGGLSLPGLALWQGLVEPGRKKREPGRPNGWGGLAYVGLGCASAEAGPGLR